MYGSRASPRNVSVHWYTGSSRAAGRASRSPGQEENRAKTKLNGDKLSALRTLWQRDARQHGESGNYVWVAKEGEKLDWRRGGLRPKGPPNDCWLNTPHE